MNLERQLEERVRDAAAALADATPVGAAFEDLTGDFAKERPKDRFSGELAFGTAFAVVLALGLISWLMLDNPSSTTGPVPDVANSIQEGSEQLSQLLAEVESQLVVLERILGNDTNVRSVDRIHAETSDNGPVPELWVVVETTSWWNANHDQHEGAWATTRSIATLYSEPDGVWKESAPGIRFHYDGWRAECTGEFMAALAAGEKSQNDWDAECRPGLTPTANVELQQMLPPVMDAAITNSSLLAVLEASGRTLATMMSAPQDAMRFEVAVFSDGTGWIELLWRDWPQSVDLRNVLSDETTFHRFGGIDLTVREGPEDNLIEVGVSDGEIYATVTTRFTDDMDLATIRDLALRFYEGVTAVLSD